ncbi:MAG: hypothetical protein HDS28_06505 [Bacteroides sp.]|nr:hypothetical protein [Bacteroides sp.]
MRTFIAFIFLLALCSLCGAKEIVILPQFEVGDTVRYRATAQVKLYHERDSMISTTKLLPTIVVEDRNSKGYIVKTTNELEDFRIECSDPASEGQLPDETWKLNEFVAPIVLNIQLDANCRPDTILNLDSVKERMLDAFIKLFAREQGIDLENSAEWKMDTKPLLISAVDMICRSKHLIEEQFGNIPYFTFNGISLKPGKIPASMVLTDELQIMCHSLDELDMEVRQVVNTESLNIGEDSGCYVIELKGNKRESSLKGKLLYNKGIMNYGYIDIKIKSETETLITNFTLDRLNR